MKKDPYRTAARPDVEPGGFRCGPKAFIVFFAVLALISFIDVMRG